MPRHFDQASTTCPSPMKRRSSISPASWHWGPDVAGAGVGVDQRRRSSRSNPQRASPRPPTSLKPASRYVGVNELADLCQYYAGHGWLDDETGRGYWLPVDARQNRRGRWLSNADITDTLKSLLAKHILVVADSCYSGTLTRGAGVKLRGADYWRRMATKRTRVALTSGGLEPVVDKGGGGHSPFAKALLDALGDNPAIMDATQLFSRMRRPVMLDADQTPQYADVRNAGHDGGDFLFVRNR